MIPKDSDHRAVYQLKPEEYYYTPEGFIVYTKEYHLRRGYCCKSGCRHCPFDFKRKDG